MTRADCCADSQRCKKWPTPSTRGAGCSKPREAAPGVRRGFAAGQEGAAPSDRVGGRQQAQAEAEAALEKLHAQHLAVSGEIAEAREQLAEAINSAAAIQDEAKRVMRDAQDEAAGGLERATAQA